MSITITEEAIREVKIIMEAQEMPTDEYMLRVGVKGGGCSGFEYDLKFAKQEEFDEKMDSMLEFGDLKAAIDKKSELYIDGTVIDFHFGLDARGFVFRNPMAKNSCGCGSSFGV